MESGDRTPAQTLMRGLDVLEAVRGGVIGLDELARKLKLTRSTTYRLASALVARQYLRFANGEGYSLGPRLLRLGQRASEATDLRRLARPRLEAMAASSGDVVNLGVLSNKSVMFLETATGPHRIRVASHVGEQRPICSTGLGKALMLDDSEERWSDVYKAETQYGPETPQGLGWLELMRRYKAQGYTFDMDENDEQVRCVAVPVRQAGGHIVAALSISGAKQYMDDVRMVQLAHQLLDLSAGLGADMGYEPVPSAKN